ncbi:MAG: DUF427 domain-containing protein [Pseudomonadota bacterium]
MAYIEITPAEGVWTVRTDDGVLVESRNAMSLKEGDYGSVIYFPRDDVAMALLEASERSSHCPHKGDAEYFHYVGASARIDDVAWSYPKVIKDEVTAIEGYLAFYGDKVTVERV